MSTSALVLAFGCAATVLSWAIARAIARLDAVDAESGHQTRTARDRKVMRFIPLAWGLAQITLGWLLWRHHTNDIREWVVLAAGVFFAVDSIYLALRHHRRTRRLRQLSPPACTESPHAQTWPTASVTHDAPGQVSQSDPCQRKTARQRRLSAVHSPKELLLPAQIS